MGSEIKSIFFSEFHPVAGPKIVYQVPDDVITKEDFDTLNVFIITKPQIQNRIITVNVLGKKIVGCPVCIDNPKYARNALIFNVCLVLDAKAKTSRYEQAIKKLAGYFTTLELENGFLSREENKAQLPAILKRMMDEMNSLGTCYVPINEATTVHLQVAAPAKDPPTVNDQDVPIFDTSHEPESVTNWDISTQQLFPYIDGYKHVARIANEADIDIVIVKACIQNLLYYGAIKIVCIFQYSNVYMCTPDITKLMENSGLQEECLSYVAKGRTPLFHNVFSLYCGLTAGTTVRDVCARHNPRNMGIDEKKLIQFGLMKGLIRRLQKYPIKLPNEHGSSKLRFLYRWCNGCHNYDEICCKTGLTNKELDDKIDSDPSIVVCWK